MVGGAMMGIGIAGKSMIYVYRAVKAGGATSAARVGSYYKGGFEKVMTRREAALILGIR